MTVPGAAARAPLTRERVVRVAVALADREGLESLSMRRLGRELGVAGMALYKHLAGKDELLDAMVDAVVAEIEAPGPGDEWRSAMRRRAKSARAALLRHPWACLVLMSRVNTGPATLRYTDATAGCLRAAGFSVEDAVRTWNALDSHLYGFVLQELRSPLSGERLPAVVREHGEKAGADHPHLDEIGRSASAGAASGVPEFVFGLDLLLEAIERDRSSRR